MADIRAWSFLAVFLLSATSVVFGYSHFRDEIPNGRFVPHPCKPNHMWNGVGHRNELGGGVRNPFGTDFENNGKKWDITLCKMDSDGDGRSNGEELGDPNCLWQKGNVPERTAGLSHPGICDPVDDLEECGPRPDYVSCDAEEFKCDATEEEGTIGLSIRFPETAVPNKETTYICMTHELKLPETRDYHLVATQPIIDNADVMHHVLIYGCNPANTVSQASNQPYDCKMDFDNACRELIGVWAVGSVGSCSHPDTGFRMGLNGYKTLAFEMHWNNPDKRADYTDSSGMKLFLTPNLRSYDSGMLMIGQIYLNIPSGSERHVATGTCPAGCTQSIFKGDIHVVNTANHMHYLGVQQRTELLRNGVKLTDLAYDEDYSYDSPVTHSFSNPIVVRQGDALKTECVFKSTSKATTTRFGQSTSDEMCFAFLTYYPKANATVKNCVARKDMAYCGGKQVSITSTTDECNFIALYTPNTPENQMINDIMSSCTYKGSCKTECLPVVRRVKEHPCFKGSYAETVLANLDFQEPTRRIELMQFFMALGSCDFQLGMEQSCPSGPTTSTRPTAPTGSTSSNQNTCVGGASTSLPVLALTVMAAIVSLL